MKEISLHILDIIQNSVKARAKNILLEIEESKSKDRLFIKIADDGCGMSEEFLAKVKDPFTTTRTTRKAGMGISLLEAAANQTGGELSITSKLGEGTTLEVRFVLSSIDRAPLGDMAETMITVISGAPDIDYIYRHKTDKDEFELNTSELRSMLGEVSLSEPEVLNWIEGYIKEGLEEIN